jgi:hypothetical protein
VITVGEASDVLQLSTRQVKRLKARYQADQVQKFEREGDSQRYPAG